MEYWRIEKNVKVLAITPSLQYSEAIGNYNPPSKITLFWYIVPF